MNCFVEYVNEKNMCEREYFLTLAAAEQEFAVIAANDRNRSVVLKCDGTTLKYRG